MPLDAITLGAAVYELQNELSDARVEKIHQPERDELLMILKSRKGQKKLVISAGGDNARIHLTDSAKENPQTPPMFCMLLRKHLTGAHVEYIKRIGYDRIVDMSFIGRNEMGDSTHRHLICEIMGRGSNIILLDDGGKIIDSVKRVDLTMNTERNILPGLKYFAPVQKNRLNPENAAVKDFSELINAIPGGKKLDREIPSLTMGISPLLAGECVFRACGVRDVCAEEMTEHEREEIAHNLFMLYDKERMHSYAPCLIKDNQSGRVIDFSPFEILQYGQAADAEKAESVNHAILEFFRLRDLSQRMQSRSAALKKQLTNKLRRTEKKLDILQKELKSASERENLRICGELITANLYRIKKGDKLLVAQNFYEDEAPEKKIVLDERKTPSQNAAWYFARYKKAKNTELYATEQIEIAKKEVQYIESVLYSISEATKASELAQIQEELVYNGYLKGDNGKKKEKKRFSLPQPMEFEYKGYTVFVGRNNIQNDYLTMKLAGNKDLWLHTKNIPGSHTVVKYKGEPFPNDVTEYAASLAAYYSKAKNAPYAEVDYCPAGHVKKPNGAKPGMVVYEGYSTALVKPCAAIKE